MSEKAIKIHSANLCETINRRFISGRMSLVERKALLSEIHKSLMTAFRIGLKANPIKGSEK